MTARLDRNTCIAHAFQGFHIDLRRRKQRLAKRRAKLLIVGVKTFLCHVKHAAYKGKAIAVHTA